MRRTEAVEYETKPKPGPDQSTFQRAPAIRSSENQVRTQAKNLHAAAMENAILVWGMGDIDWNTWNLYRWDNSRDLKRIQLIETHRAAWRDWRLRSRKRR